MRLITAIRYGRVREWAEMRVAWMLPRRIALWAMVRVAAHATTGKWGNESPDSIGFKEMHDRWVKP
jgi:hypothetical protein